MRSRAGESPLRVGVGGGRGGAVVENLIDEEDVAGVVCDGGEDFGFGVGDVDVQGIEELADGGEGDSIARLHEEDAGHGRRDGHDDVAGGANFGVTDDGWADFCRRSVHSPTQSLTPTPRASSRG